MCIYSPSSGMWIWAKHKHRLSHGRKSMRWSEKIKQNPESIWGKTQYITSTGKQVILTLKKRCRKPDWWNYLYKLSLDRNIKRLHLKPLEHERSEEGWRKLHVIKSIFSQAPTIGTGNGYFKRCKEENIAKCEHRKHADCLAFIQCNYKNTDDTHPRACLILNWFKGVVKITDVSGAIKHMLSCNSFYKYRALFHGVQK